MKLKRAIYLGYYLKQLDRARFMFYLNYASKLTGESRLVLLSDILRSVFIYNISPLDYFLFRFYELSKQEREAWAGTGYMYEYQLRMNPKDSRQTLEDKTLFYKHYGDFFVHKVADIKDLKTKVGVAEAILSNPSGKLVFKSAVGNCGNEVHICDCKDFDWLNIIVFMEKNNYQLVEEYLIQHSDLNRLSSSAVNTVRIFTQLDDRGEVNILGCRLRISVNSPVDNLAAGNLAAPIDEKTGRLSGPAVFSDITKSEVSHHPVTNEKIPGFQVPFWEETIQMVRKAAQLHPQNRSIGWDIVITKNGPGLIEGNHDWCKLLWQLPEKSGLKQKLMNYQASVVRERLYSKYAKRLFDLVVSGLVIILTSPFFLIASLLLWIENRGDIFFTQRRPGYKEKPFDIIKFKTMNDKRDVDGNLLPDMQRITKVGKWLRKFSLDELPQLWNVLKGDMSMIGPRPLLFKYIPLYTYRQRRRHEVKPGITGWAQVNGRNAISWEKKFELDLYYIENISFALDMKIAWLTVIKILKREGINQSELRPMHPFEGNVS